MSVIVADIHKAVCRKKQESCRVAQDGFCSAGKPGSRSVSMDVVRSRARRSSSAFTRAATDPPTIVEGQLLRMAPIGRSDYPMPGMQPARLLHLLIPCILWVLRNTRHGKKHTVAL